MSKVIKTGFKGNLKVIIGMLREILLCLPRLKQLVLILHLLTAANSFFF